MAFGRGFGSPAVHETGGPVPPTPQTPVPSAPTPNAAGFMQGNKGANLPQDNGTTSQMKRMLSMLGTLPIQHIDTPEEREMAGMMAEQLELVAAQLKQQAAKKGDINFVPGEQLQ